MFARVSPKCPMVTKVPYGTLHKCPNVTQVPEFTLQKYPLISLSLSLSLSLSTGEVALT